MTADKGTPGTVTQEDWMIATLFQIHNGLSMHPIPVVCLFVCMWVQIVTITYFPGFPIEKYCVYSLGG